MSEQEIHKWFIAHIAYRNESNVKNLLDIAGLEYYMPFKSVSLVWNGMKRDFQVPAIPFCVFVRVTQSDFIMLHMMREISLLLDGEGSPLSLSDEQMESVRAKLDVSDNPGAHVLDLMNSYSKTR